MDPYVSDPAHIPSTDLYADVPFYGRYFPRADDFQVDRKHVNSQCAASLKYWTSVVDLCDESVRIYPAEEGGRDVFALGAIIVKSSHLHSIKNGQCSDIDYSYADANELQAIALSKSVLKNVQVPEIYFAGKINGRQTLVQERIPGVGLNVAVPYLSPSQKESFKKQAREILQQLLTIKPSDGRRARGHVVQDPNILTNGRIHPLEGELLFTDAEIDSDLGFMHNDLTESNCIVYNDKIVGLVDWEMAGFIGWKVAGEIHRRIRTPQREHFANVEISEERLRGIMWWRDLYDEFIPQY